MINVLVHGFMGKMGRVICRMVEQDDSLNLLCGVDAVVGNNSENFPVFSSLDKVNVKADVIIDFSTAQAVPALLEYAQKTKTPVVICTTGLSNDMINRAKAASTTVPVFLSFNMSLGINLLAMLLKKCSPVLADAGFDIEIVERHHNQKIDAPSGTAILLADAVNESLNNSYSYTYDRSKSREKRGSKEIGMSSIRGGTIVGRHDVIFAGLDEVIELTHIAQSKEVFGNGAVNAAKFLAEKEQGMFDMQDLLQKYI